MSGHNVHAPHFRETKPPQAGPQVPVQDLFRLDKRTIVITGAAGFLGTTLATAILQSGADVVAFDLRPSPPGDIWPDIEAAATTNGGKLTYHSVDVADETSITQAFVELMPALRYRIRGLVACAGISDNGPAVDFPAASIRHMLDVNVTGTFLIAQAIARQMIKDDVSGSMVLVASMSGYVSNKGVDTAGYNSSRAAVQQLARSLAAEWGSRINVPLIRVNSLSPGYIRTAATAEALQKPGMEEQWVGDNMLYRLSTADEFRAPS
ncbi:Short chain dehydrogenase-like protein 19 [Elsinoe fawcettii]|nr:Short chain dehydrogenase-like protein 19 [Elsinoe fawcettii]